MEQFARRSRPHGIDLDELPLIPTPRRETSPVSAAPTLPDLLPTLLPELDDEVDSDLPAQAAAPAIEVGALSERECDILTFEKQWWRHAGAKEQAIRDRFELSGTRYYQLLNALLDKPAALEQDPILVGRLRRLRGSRARSRRR